MIFFFLFASSSSLMDFSLFIAAATSFSLITSAGTGEKSNVINDGKSTQEKLRISSSGFNALLYFHPNSTETYCVLSNIIKLEYCLIVCGITSFFQSCFPVSSRQIYCSSSFLPGRSNACRHFNRSSPFKRSIFPRHFANICCIVVSSALSRIVASSNEFARQETVR